MGKIKKSTIVLVSIISIITFIIFNRIGQLYILSHCGYAFWNGLIYVFDNILRFDKLPFILVMEKNILLVSIIGFIFVWLIFAYIWASKKNFLKGKEHGSARWGTKKDIEPFIDHTNPDNNIIFSETERLSLSPYMKNPIYNRNKNVLVIGGSGKGKSRFVAKPNLCQLNTSFVITDPKGELLEECGEMLAVQGNYNIKILNLEDMSKSDKFNFFAYIHTETDILILVDNILFNTTSSESETRVNSGDDFWNKAERAFLTALFAYLVFECRREDRTVNGLLDLMAAAEAREENEDYVSALDVLFEDLAKSKPNCLACYMYHMFKLASGKTAKSILVSVGVRLAPFAINDVRNLTSEDTLELDKIVKEKTALFLIAPETYTSYNFILCILYQFMLERFYRLAKQSPGRRAPVPVQIIGDEIANIGHIPNLERYIATMRAYGISTILIFQTMTQIESMDKQNWKTIVGNCDTFVYLGGKEQSTNEYVSKSIGKMTIDQRQTNETKGSHGSYGNQDSTLGRDMLDPSEVEKLPGDECIVMISGVEPFKSKKYPLEKHPRYKYLADGGAAIFNIERRNELSIKNFFKNTKQVISITLDDTF